MFQKAPACDLTAEKLEEIRMNTGFKLPEITQYRRRFVNYVQTAGVDEAEERLILREKQEKKIAIEKEKKEKEEKERKEKEEKKKKEKLKEGEGEETVEDKSTDDDKSSNEGDDKGEKVHKEDASSDDKESTTSEAKSTSTTEKSIGSNSASSPQNTTTSSEPFAPDTWKITRQQFLGIPAIQMNPLKHRLAMLFDLEAEDASISFEVYMDKCAQFNSIGNREQKIKLAFKIQDFDGDDKLDRHDLSKYYGLVARNGDVETKVDKDTRRQIVNFILQESSSDARQKFLSFEDFQRVVAPTDFDNFLRLGI